MTFSTNPPFYTATSAIDLQPTTDQSSISPNKNSNELPIPRTRTQTPFSLHGKVYSPIEGILQGMTLIEKNDRIKTTAGHCSLSTMNDASWQGATCSYKNLCYDPKLKDFVFYRAFPEMSIPLEVNLGKGKRFLPRIVEGACTHFAIQWMTS